MPEIDALMQEWSPSFEELLRQVRRPPQRRSTLGHLGLGAHCFPPHTLSSTPLSLSLSLSLSGPQVPLPTADMDMSTEQYARTVCALLDIPVHSASSGAGSGNPGPLIQSLHVLFSLYTEFRDNPHFSRLSSER